MSATAPTHLVAGGLSLRRLGPEDAPAMVRAVNESLEHLRPFMRWAQEPADEAKTALRLSLAGTAMEAGGDATYGIFESCDPQAELVGSAGLHDITRGGHANIGYWVHVERTRQGIATRAAAGLAHLGLVVFSLEHVEIHCDVANAGSAAVARRLGFEHVDTVDGGPGGAPGDAGRTMVWRLTAGAWPESAAARVDVELRIDPPWGTRRSC